MGRFLTIASIGWSLLYCGSAAATLETVANPALPEPPMVLSYATQPVSHFNKTLAQAQQQQKAWSHDPELISQRYAGASFELVKSKKYQGQLITYSVRPPKLRHPQMLLILALDRKNGRWELHKARLSWRCAKDDFFSTNHCKTSDIPTTGAAE